MTRRWANVAIAGSILALLAAGSAWAQGPAAPNTDRALAAAPPNHDTPDAPADLALVAIDKAAKAGKYIFVFFYRAEDEPTLAARKTLAAAMETFADRATSTAVDVTDALEQELVNKYQVNRSPLPLVLALAPTGAVTRGFPAGQFTEAQLETAFVSPGMQKCLKALQDRKLVFVCVQNDATQHNAEAMLGVKEFAADAQYAKTTEIITVDPKDAAEASLLAQFQVNPQTAEAVTVFLAPPGVKVATYTGETKKDVLAAAAKTAGKGCTPGSSCCPAPKKPATPAKQQPGTAEQKP